MSESDESVASHVMQKMVALVEINMEQPRSEGTTRLQVLVLLPTPISKLLAQWQGPYEVVKAVGKVNYLVDMCGRGESSM